MTADVAESGRRQNGVSECMRHAVTVGMPEQTRAVRDVDATEHQRTAFDKTVRVDSMAD